MDLGAFQIALLELCKEHKVQLTAEIEIAVHRTHEESDMHTRVLQVVRTTTPITISFSIHTQQVSEPGFRDLRFKSNWG